MIKTFDKIIPTIIFTTVVFVIFQKLFAYTNCYSFDVHDDSNHAFPNLRLVRESILNFQFSFFNFFNNFGQPLLGDGLTYPYSIQSITYYFFDDYLAMTINRVLIFLFTLLIGYRFFLYYFKKDTSIILSILSVFNPVAFWYPVHHYQMTLLFYFSLLYLIKTLLIFNNKKLIILFFIIFVFFINSVSILHVLLSLPFFFLFTLISNNRKFDRNLLIILGLIISAFILTGNQNLEFIENIQNSGRNNQFVYSSDLSNLRELFLSLIIPPKEWFSYNYGAQNSMITYYSFPILSGIFLGLYLSFNNKNNFFLKALICGLIPFILVILLNYLSVIRIHIPFIKSIDIKRLFYFCYPFTLFFLGYFIELSWDNKIKKISLRIFSGLLTLVIIFTFWYFEEIENVNSFYFFNMSIFLISILYYSFSKKHNKNIFYSLFILSIFLSLIPSISIITGINNVCKGGSTQYSTQSEESDFIPASFIKYIKPYSRLVAEVHTHKGHGLRLSNHKIFGGDARAIIIDKEFGNLLENKGLIKIHQVPYAYYFKRPWNIEELNNFSIRYIITHKRKPIKNNNLKFIADSTDYILYENKFKPSIVYFQSRTKEKRYFEDITVVGNELRINNLKTLDLTKYSKLNVSIMHRDRFEIYDENQKRIDFIKNNNNLISINLDDIDNSDKIIIKYEYNFLKSLFFFLFQ